MLTRQKKLLLVLIWGAYFFFLLTGLSFILEYQGIDANVMLYLFSTTLGPIGLSLLIIMPAIRIRRICGDILNGEAARGGKK